MARSLRGLTKGFQEGLKIGGALRGIRRDQDLANESERYGVTEGAYGQELGQNIQQLQGLQAQDPGQAAIYQQSIDELTRRQGMTAPDFSVGSRAQNFGTREEAEMAAKPMRTQGLAGVYRQYGEIEKADELLARADQQKLTGLQTQAAEMTVKERERALASQKRIDDLNAWRAENPKATVQEIKDVARTQFKLDDDQLFKVTSTITGLAENDLKQFQAEVKNTIKGQNLDGLVNIFNTDDRFDPATSIKTTRGKDGSVSLSFVGQDGKTISAEKFKSEALATAYLNKQAVEPDTVAEWLLGIQKTQAAIAASEAGAFKDRQTGLNAGRETAPRAATIAELNTMAKGMIDSGMEDPDAPGTPLSYTKALAIARSEAAGMPYKSAADKLVEAMVAQRTPPDATAPRTVPATSSRGLFTDPQGRTQLLQPLSDLNSWRRRLVEDQNAASGGGGLTGGF